MTATASDSLTAWRRWVAGVQHNEQPFTANDPCYPIALAAFYAGRDSVTKENR